MNSGDCCVGRVPSRLRQSKEPSKPWLSEFKDLGKGFAERIYDLEFGQPPPPKVFMFIPEPCVSSRTEACPEVQPPI